MQTSNDGTLVLPWLTTAWVSDYSNPIPTQSFGAFSGPTRHSVSLSSESLRCCAKITTQKSQRDTLHDDIRIYGVPVQGWRDVFIRAGRGAKQPHRPRGLPSVSHLHTAQHTSSAVGGMDPSQMSFVLQKHPQLTWDGAATPRLANSSMVQHTDQQGVPSLGRVSHISLVVQSHPQNE